MSWMDFKTAQAMKAQKLSSDSKRAQLGTQKGTKEKPSQTIDTLTKNRLDAQRKAEHAKREGLLHHKGDQAIRSEKKDFDYAPPAGSDAPAHHEAPAHEEAAAEPAYEEPAAEEPAYEEPAAEPAYDDSGAGYGDEYA
eukprot:TRINITY_DN33905_c0_g1_i1.p1 TRINITY_DN33905_c0_g1~~TRINITY_DN33905_c0_g1_i1.p1  ORF type:complete len:160 (-),score=36.02 TRINITY_DN33905_c0_g1_i1:68-481(-)